MNIQDEFHESWKPIVKLLYKEPLKTLSEKVLPNVSYQPARENVFKVFSMPVSEIKVVILGQDPYPTAGDAIGYAFVNGRNKTPKSLEIIEREIEVETSYSSQGIDTWPEQGVFLLNSALTVETGKAGSHLKYWEEFTGNVVNFIAHNNTEAIFVLWGRKAQKYKEWLYSDTEVLTAPHPAAEVYSGGKAGFYGCNHFNKINELLTKQNKDKILW